MKCLVKETKYSKTLREGDINLLSFLKNPSPLPKEKLPLWRFITFKPGVRNAVDQTLYDTIHMLIVEFDTGTTIQAVEAIASEYAYALHTTSNHSKSLHKFRLMLPLDQDYPEALWREDHVKNAMREKFPALDRSCFVNFQCVPALPPNPNDYYHRVHNGRRFSYSDIETIIDNLKLNAEIDCQFENSKHNNNFLKQDNKVFDSDAYIEKWVIGRLDTIDWNRDNSGRFASIQEFCGCWSGKANREGNWLKSEIIRACEMYRLPTKYLKTVKSMLK